MRFRTIGQKPEALRKWNNRERWKTARLVIRVFLCYSPRGIGNALIIAGMLINCIDKTWEKTDDGSTGAASSDSGRKPPA